MPREIGIAVQPKTYLTQQMPTNFRDRATTAINGLREMVGRAVTSFVQRSNQGFSGALAAAYAGHTVSLGVNSARQQPSTISTGFSPDGYIASFTMWLQGTSGNPQAAVPGANHDESGVTADPQALALTVPVGAGLYAAFESFQSALPGSRNDGLYSWRPTSPLANGNQQQTENCVTNVNDNMQEFIDTAHRHLDVMQELQGGQLSDNQLQEQQSLAALQEHVQQIDDITTQRAQANRGNQGPVTNYVAGVQDQHNNDQANTRAQQQQSFQDAE